MTGQRMVLCMAPGMTKDESFGLGGLGRVGG